MANTFYIDYQGGNDSNDGLSFANRKKTIAGVATGSISPGDEYRLIASPGPHTLNTNATWTNNSNTLSLSTNVNILLYDGGTAWTAATVDITCTSNTTGRRDQNLSAAQTAIAAAFTTGKAAYFTLPASTNCAAHSGLSFWYYHNKAQATANLSIRLCSDTTGDTSVNTITIPRINVANAWFPCYVETGTTFGSGIQSVALYVDTDPGPLTVILQNINTVKPNTSNDNLNITSVIGTGRANDGWWPVRSINATTIYLDGGSQMSSAKGIVLGYPGNTETISLMKYDPIQFANNWTSTLYFVVPATLPIKSGNAIASISITGGWNRTDMSTQTGESWFDAMWSTGTLFFGENNRDYMFVDKCHMVRGYGALRLAATTGSRFGTVFSAGAGASGIIIGLNDSAANNLISAASLSIGIVSQFNSGLVAGITGIANANTIVSLCAGSGTAAAVAVDGWNNQLNSTGEHDGKTGTIITRGSKGAGVTFYYPMSQINIDTIISTNNTLQGVTYNNSFPPHQISVNQLVADNNRTYGLELVQDHMGKSRFGAVTVANNSTHGVHLQAGSRGGERIWIGQLTGLQFGTTSAIRGDDYSVGTIHILNSTFTGNALSFGSANTNLRWPGEIVLRNYNGTAGDHRTYYHNNIAHIYASTEQRHTASGYAWKFAPRHTHYINEVNSLKKTIATIAVGAGTLVTIGVWAYRDNTGIFGRLYVEGRQIAGVNNDVYVTTTGSAGAWEQLTTTFTPTETGVVEVQMRVWGGNTYNLWIDDFSMSQA